MRLRLAVAVLAGLVTGCGYVGDPLPPALHIPMRVTDLRAIQRGDRLIIQFTAPALTTEQLGIREFGEVDLRVGPLPTVFSVEAWADGAKRIDVEQVLPGEPVLVETAADSWTGREVLAGVRFSTARGRPSEWSNTAMVNVRDPLPRPVLKAEPHPEGVRLIWSSADGGQTRIARKSEGQQEAETIATVEGSDYIDRSVTVGKVYAWSVQTVLGTAESEFSEPVRITRTDEFAPAPPAGLNVVAGLDSIELAWDRSTESDFAGYRIYRAEGAGSFSLLADSVETPAWSDRQVTSGITYRYRVTARDRSGNESAPGEPVEAAAP